MPSMRSFAITICKQIGFSEKYNDESQTYIFFWCPTVCYMNDQYLQFI